MATMEHPLNNHRIQVGSIGPFFGTLFLGPFYFLIRGNLKHFFLWFVFATFTLGISHIFYPFMARGMITNQYLEKGYKVVA